MNSRERCLAAIRGEPADRTPVFPLVMHLAADRYGVTYRQFARDGGSMAAAQVQFYRSFRVDAITACSDAFRLSADLGGAIVFPEQQPPHLERPLVTSSADVVRLGHPDPARAGSRMADRVSGVAAMVREVGDQCLVLGWVDMPFAEACSACGVQEFMLLLCEDPALAHRLLDHLTGCVIDFALAQLKTGAPTICCGDAAASLVSPVMYREFALPYEQRVTEAIHAADGMAKLHICGNTTALLEDMTRCGADLFNVDHMVDFDRAIAVYGAANLAFKGNLNPVEELLRAGESGGDSPCPHRPRRGQALLAQRRLRSARCHPRRRSSCFRNDSSFVPFEPSGQSLKLIGKL
jgi:MtaA/CmuA family methyltransferase